MENKRLIISVGSPIAGGTVDSVFGRTGNVIAENGDYTTSLVTESTDKKYVTDAEKTVLSNTSGTNTGDETTSSIQTKRPLKTVGGVSLEGSGNIELPDSAVDSVNGKLGVVVLSGSDINLNATAPITLEQQIIATQNNVNQNSTDIQD